MNWCCGAMMIGSIGALRVEGIVFERLPLVYCPVCRRFEVHPLVSDAFELLLDYAQGDNARHIVFDDFVTIDEAELRAHQPLWDDGEPLLLIQASIDQALDLLSAAKALGDVLWKRELGDRLKRLAALKSKIEERQN
ncbi:MAG: hypothetical protein IMW86_01610 [Hydrogenibacillus sp.]|nr:hypothetical protein [Hydrogenibacillus sp.]